MYLNQIIGRPYALPSDPPWTFDCFSLVEFIRREFYQLPTPIPFEVTSLATKDINRVIVKVVQLGTWVKVKNPQPGDVVHMETNHIGVLVPNGVVHAWRCRSGLGSVVMTGDRTNSRFFAMLGYLRLRDE